MAGREKVLQAATATAAVGGRKAWTIIKRGAASKAVKRAAKTAGEGAATAVASTATKGGGSFLTDRREDRKNRRLAMDLGRQIGGQVSVRTVIAGERYYVVWRDDEPIETFPRLAGSGAPLHERPELVGRRVTPPPE